MDSIEILTDSAKVDTIKVLFYVQGMTCASCVVSIEELLKKMKGIDHNSISISVIPPRISLVYDQSITSLMQIATHLNESGYMITGSESFPENSDSRTQSNILKTELSVFGMSCASCVSAIENKLMNYPGIESISVNLLMKRVLYIILVL